MKLALANMRDFLKPPTYNIVVESLPTFRQQNLSKSSDLSQLSELFLCPAKIAQNLAQKSHQKTAKDVYFTVFGRKQALERLSRARAFLTPVIIC